MIGLLTSMASICDTACGAAAVAPIPYDADCITVTSKAGIEHFFTVQCDQAIV